MPSTFADAANIPDSAAVSGPLLRVCDLQAHFRARQSWFSRESRTVRAVDGVSFNVFRGATFGIVGESGCGKSTLLRTLLRLIPATSGRVEFDGNNILDLRGAPLRALRRRMQIVFQDTAGSLNPRFTVDWLVGEALHVHRLVSSADERRERVAELLVQVGLSRDDIDRYPHQFSGGQRQRIGIARALALSPELLICDEPVSALDVSIQSQILNLIQDIKQSRGLTLLFVSHNLAIMRQFCDEIAVMHRGRIVEQAPAAMLFAAPKHPYTQTLLAAVPRGCAAQVAS